MYEQTKLSAPLSPRTGRSLDDKDFMQTPEVIAGKELVHK